MLPPFRPAEGLPVVVISPVLLTHTHTHTHHSPPFAGTGYWVLVQRAGCVFLVHSIRLSRLVSCRTYVWYVSALRFPFGVGSSLVIWRLCGFASLSPPARPFFRNPPPYPPPRYRTYEVLKEETANPRVRWSYLPYSMHMAGPREVSWSCSSVLLSLARGSLLLWTRCNQPASQPASRARGARAVCRMTYVIDLSPCFFTSA